MTDGEPLPQLVFVLGKGGVGRSTVAAALALAAAARGDRALVVQWTVRDGVSPWFGLPPVGHAATRLAAGVDTMNYSLDETLREYFVDHLHLARLHRWVIASRAVRSFTRAAPGLAELLFLGRLEHLVNFARAEQGFTWDRIVVDTPAMGHGMGLFAVATTAAAMGFGGLLAVETRRVDDLLADPRRSAALVVTTPEELAVEETLELLPRFAVEVGRPPAVLVVNRSVARLGPLPLPPSSSPWLARLVSPVEAADARDALARLYTSLAHRRMREQVLADRLAPATTRGALAVDDVGLVERAPGPADVVRFVAPLLAALLDGRAR